MSSETKKSLLSKEEIELKCQEIVSLFSDIKLSQAQLILDLAKQGLVENSFVFVNPIRQITKQAINPPVRSEAVGAINNIPNLTTGYKTPNYDSWGKKLPDLSDIKLECLKAAQLHAKNENQVKTLFTEYFNLVNQI